MEIELKMVIAPEDARRLLRSPLLASARRSAPSSRKLLSVYYDTPERHLARAGMALRLRREGRQWIQTFKCGGGTAGGLHQREEHEVPVRAGSPDLAALAATAAAPLLIESEVSSRLAPVFTTSFQRTSVRVEIFPEAFAELCVDLGEITAGGRRAPIHEVEIELENGSPAHLFGFARRMLEVADLRLENASKAQRGYALADGIVQGPIRARPPVLGAAVDADGLFSLVVGSAVDQFLANASGAVAGEDPEFLHQARVALRRLRSALRLFRPHVPRSSVADLSERLGEMATAVGPARDWDVFLGETLPAVSRAFPDEASFAAVARAGRRQRDEAGPAVARALAGPRCTAIFLDLATRMTEAPWAQGEQQARDGRDLARRILRRQWRRVRVAGKALSHEDTASLHRLRIEVKRLRYAADFFSTLNLGKGEAFARDLAGLQDVLGRINDEAVTGRLLQQLAAQDTGIAYELGVVRGFCRALAGQALEQFDAAWQRFARRKPYW